MHLLAKVARMKGRDVEAIPSAGSSSSILMLAAASYGARPAEDATVPTGFDPVAVQLFEAIVEAAFVVASADGVFDADERATFSRVVTAACGGVVAPKHIADLVADLSEQLSEDGIERRIEVIGSQVRKEAHGREVLRIAGLIAQASEDVSATERDVLVKVAKACGLAEGDVDVALREVEEALAGA